METAIIALTLGLVGYQLYCSLRVAKQAFEYVPSDAELSLYEKLVNEGIYLSEQLMNSGSKHFMEIIKANNKINEWDAKVQRLTRFAVVNSSHDPNLG
ncbi:hypothetical protein [Alteromonas sp. a30]|uniref:hypothetical protein n=1 Tax=Alteromonas sp. a30 TaxID=2730917 RepID=UPI00227FA29A|nr:hypothetical protein [Alteromonas sp. a30]MCY7294605.1 hypothetical protein [Alteromonas sp. a30]